MNSSAILWQPQGDGVLHLVLDKPESSVNTMDAAFLSTLETVLERIDDEREALKGVVVRSAKQSFLAGADLGELAGAGPADAGRWRETSRRTKEALRRLETLGLPVVSLIAGPALGGGLELALATHRRIAVSGPSVRVGLPEVTLGLLPGAGGIVRSVRLLGLDTALDALLLEGRQVTSTQAHELGLLDEIVADEETGIARAHAWIGANREARQPWDVKGHRPPGRRPAESAPLTARLQNRLRGADYPAPKAILSAAVEGLAVDFATAEAIEERHFVNLVTGGVSTNMVQTFFDRQTVTRRPRKDGAAPREFSRVAVLGAGMMGAGIAYSCAAAGLDVVLVDTTQEKAERGKSYTERVLSRRGMDPVAAAQVLERIHPTDDFADTKGADALIEAVFEDPAVKDEALRKALPHLAEDALLASNTSTLPISGLARSVDRPADFLGMHFFSPVDRMELVEIIRGAQTSDEAVQQSLDLVRQIRKVPIVVNDSRGFFTSRTFTAYTYEAMAMVGEGIPAPTIEQAAVQAGFPGPLLQMMDEVTLTLPRDIREAARRAAAEEGREWSPHPADAVLDTMIEHGRRGRRSGGAFYDFADGKRVGLWPGLTEVYGGDTTIPFEDAQERLLFIGALTAIRCLEEGVLQTVAEGNIGSLLGIGYPAWTGGALQFVNTYAGGPAGFAERTRELEQRYGDRFAPPQLLLDKVAAGGAFHDDTQEG